MHCVQCKKVVVVFFFLFITENISMESIHLLNRIGSTIITKILHFNEFPLSWRDKILETIFHWLIFLAFQLIIFISVNKWAALVRLLKQHQFTTKCMKNNCICSVNTLFFLFKRMENAL